MIETVSEHLHRVLDRIDKAARRSGRNPQEITLVAVTKTVSFERVLPFMQAGIRHLGENRVQEALTKYTDSEGNKQIDATMHLIGTLQINKAKKAAAFFNMIQSLDRLELAEALNRHARELGRALPCLVEIKVSSEPTKSGLPPGQLEDFLESLKSCSYLAIRGLMGIAPLAQTAEETRPFFKKLRTLFEKSKLEVLSMGMSSDFEVAIEEGSTMVRIGTALFGGRQSTAFSPGRRG